MEWTKKSVEELIEAWCQEPCLFLVKHPAYHNKHARKEAMERVAERVRVCRGPTTPGDVQGKMKSLRTTYVHELNKVKASERSGAGLLDLYQPSIWYFTKMKFLQDQVQPRKSTTNFEEAGDLVSPREVNCSDIQLLELGDAITVEVDGGTDISQGLSISPSPPTSGSSNMGDVNLPVSPSPSSCGSSKGGAIKRKRTEEPDAGLLKKAQAVLDQISLQRSSVSPLDTFGQYVSATLKGIQNKKLQLKAKNAILKILMDVEEEDTAIN